MNAACKNVIIHTPGFTRSKEKTYLEILEAFNLLLRLACTGTLDATSMDHGANIPRNTTTRDTFAQWKCHILYWCHLQVGAGQVSMGCSAISYVYIIYIQNTYLTTSFIYFHIEAMMQLWGIGSLSRNSLNDLTSSVRWVCSDLSLDWRLGVIRWHRVERLTDQCFV